MNTKKESKKQKQFQKQKGITLVALVVTIIVLLILAGITITILFGDNGIIKSAQKAKTETERDKADTQNGLVNLADQMAIQLGEDVSSLVKLAKAGTIVTERTEVTDKVGNKVVVPKGFRLTTEGTTVQDGIVIEDSEGNEFVWIPVGVVTKDDGSKSNEIKLGRYTFSTSSPGAPTLADGSYQYAYTEENPTNYTQEVPIDLFYKEIATRTNNPDGFVDNSDYTNYLNAIAKDLKGFVESVKTNGGYYLARYEASYGSGYEPTGSDDIAKYENAKPLSQPSENKGDSSMNYTKGTLWNFITQINASKVCRNMYTKEDNVGVESDLVNSYAWDTAIVYIQEMGVDNFANMKGTDVGSTSLVDTGSNSSDKFCNIYDMVANIKEWSTEYSTYSSSSGPSYLVIRSSSYYNSDVYTAHRYRSNIINNNSCSDSYGFRPLLYVK